MNASEPKASSTSVMMDEHALALTFPKGGSLTLMGYYNTPSVSGKSWQAVFYGHDMAIKRRPSPW